MKKVMEEICSGVDEPEVVEIVVDQWLDPSATLPEREGSNNDIHTTYRKQYNKHKKKLAYKHVPPPRAI